MALHWPGRLNKSPPPKPLVAGIAHLRSHSSTRIMRFVAQRRAPPLPAVDGVRARALRSRRRPSHAFRGPTEGGHPRPHWQE
eukprot:4115340-Pyramimonas_sp.AAC.1